MNTHHSTLFTLIAALAVTFSACKEEENPFYPTQPTSISIEDGAVLLRSEDGSLENYYDNHHPWINVNGSYNEKGTTIKYKYYISDDNTMFNKYTPGSVLEPNKHYFWYAVPFALHYNGDTVWGEKTAIHNFYYINQLNYFTTDNGDSEIAATIKFNKLKGFKNYRLTITPTEECGFSGKTFYIPEDKDSCYISIADNPEIPYMFNDYDDLNGTVYKPVIYNFTLSADITVGDKTITNSRTVNEIFLNKSNHVRDNEFNVYRVAEIGNQIWIIDDLRCKTIIGDVDVDKINDKYRYDSRYGDYIAEYPNEYIIEVPVKFSKEKITMYAFSHMWGDRAPIKGFKFARDIDWEELLVHYGFKYSRVSSSIEKYIAKSSPSWMSKYDPQNAFADSIYDKFYYTEQYNLHYNNFFREVCASKYGWTDNKGEPTGNGFLNIRPYGYVDKDSVWTSTQGLFAVYFCVDKQFIHDLNCLLVFDCQQEGVGYFSWVNFDPDDPNNDYYTPVRCVRYKD